jgi:hypothetical protein
VECLGLTLGKDGDVALPNAICIFFLYMAKKSFAEYPVFWHPVKSYIYSAKIPCKDPVSGSGMVVLLVDPDLVPTATHST